MKAHKYRIICTIAWAFSLCLLLSLGVHAQTITTIAGNGVFGYSGDGGPATSAEMKYPRGLAVDTAGNLFVADESNNLIREINAVSGIINTVAGNGSAGFSGDGGNAVLAKLFYPSAIAIDSSGNIYIADNDNNRIRKVTKSTGIITTIAGNGTPGFSGDGGSAILAEVNQPSGLAIDDSNNLFISDTYNKRIREINAKTGVITTVAGNGVPGFSGDGGMATVASVNFAIGIAVDTMSNLYIADTQNSRIRKVNLKSGIITTVCGDSVAGFSGDGGQASSAELNYPIGIGTDIAGNVYIADTHNNCIRKIDVSTGIINTIAGNNMQGFSGDGGPATSAELNSPCSVIADKSGNVYASDEDNYRVRKISAPLGINELSNFETAVVYPNPSSGLVHVMLNGTGYTSIKVVDILGREICSFPVKGNRAELNLENVPNGIYIMRIVTRDGIITKRIIIEK